ncbi:MAG: bifunctional tRNA (5-methylaminomethyl-2-thiouridine)(34)-methyltransferase MnmD/FAD-dependent 5-carboxymethylaminomethyl-2-thiouridine(34) oxidoreductase MnmC [Pseudomonadota bacterium]
MILARGAFAPLEGNDLSWDASGHPRSTRYGDGYFGGDDAVAESRHVFLAGSGLPERFAIHARPRFVVAELGFGTGLNFLLTWAAHREHAPTSQRLHFISIDSHPLRRAELEKALAAYGALDPQKVELINALPPPVEGVHRRFFDGGRVVLDLIWADAQDALEELAHSLAPAVDAWFLDGFAPRRNPAMWTEELLLSVARVCRDGATVATYSAAGAVRRALHRAGFDVAKRPGFGRKRESLHGRLRLRPPALPPRLTPWDLPEIADDAEAEHSALVIGAGLAGAHVAAALARRGWGVTVVDAGTIAARASGNPQGLLFNRFSHQRSALSDFSLTALLFARHLYGGLFDQGLLVEGRDGALNGCLQTAPPRGDFRAAREAVAQLPELAEVVRATEAQPRLGTTPGEGGLWHHESGWLSPPRVCRALLAMPGIRLEQDCGRLTLERRNGRWEARDERGKRRVSAPIAVVAAGVSSVDFAAGDGFGLRVARGQTTQVPKPEGIGLHRSVCHHGYIAPALDGAHCIGASFLPGDHGRELRVAEHRSNLDALARALPDWAAYLATLDPEKLEGRAELRCVSPDYLPVAGPIPQRAAFEHRYAGLGRNARRSVDRRGAYHPGLYLSTAMGSRGLSYAALAGEQLASQIAGDTLPLPAELSRALAPARFLIRAIVRGEGPNGENH